MNQQRKNILLITSDQQHWSALGRKNPFVKTPNLDALAAQGTLFNRAYCPNPTCTPSRASMITGLYPSQHGAWSLGTKLPEGIPTVGDALLAADYRTALIGKAHFHPLLGTERHSSLESYPILHDMEFWRNYKKIYYGFEHIELLRNHADEAHVGQHYAIWMEERGFLDWRKCFRKPTGSAEPQFHTWNLPEEFHYNTWIAERTNAMLDRHREADENFFLWASFPDPHPPYLAPEPWASLYDPAEIELPQKPDPSEIQRNPPHYALTQQREPDFSPWSESGQEIHGMHSHRYQNGTCYPGYEDEAAARVAVATYFGMVSMMDHYIGKILDHLEELGLADDTIVVFTSDHGHFYGQHGLVAKGPFHYEDLVRVPFITRTPGQSNAGEESNALISLVDLTPTFLDFAGRKIPSSIAGVSQLETLLGKRESPRRHVIIENRHEPTTIYLSTYVDDRFKLTLYYNRDYGELFDLVKDPEERYNRWNDPEYRRIKEELLLKFLHAEMGKAPIPMPRIAPA